MDTTTYKLARAIGGRSNFAEVTVSIERDASMNAAYASEHLTDPNVRWGIPHAIAGAHRALEEFGDDATSVRIVALIINEADSNPDIIAVAAYIAASQALSADGILQSFVVDGRLNFTPRVR
ncbi:hypothetical protein RISK_004473 [Rhodopirellula islandica]|uniref:Uncharacterized protein n=1 Tax=Rhodopirellula islandica TaxID=595434 RepID=A0A0J1B9S3_RHOIS|nr:hypothetical protein [Rhodopirellula islandica]KLU03467.1 hypothetical protein RISK_004471 [Rhodopirellula islandica]KLU03469.1 hypothetical protein RISK_004473 [Rhodopirellula islandica]